MFYKYSIYKDKPNNNVNISNIQNQIDKTKMVPSQLYHKASESFKNLSDIFEQKKMTTNQSIDSISTYATRNLNTL